MSELFRKYLLSSTALYAPDNEGAGDPPDDGDDRIPEPDIEDDETSTDPVDETESDEPDAADDTADDDADAGEEPPPAAARASRGDRQMGALREERRRLAEENARITRQLDELRRAPAQPPAPVETPQQRADRLALMSPEERTQAIIDEALQRNQANTNQVMGQLLDQSDRATFEARTSNSPILKKLAPRIEQELQNLRSQGRNLDRMAIAKYLIGERVLEQQGKAKPAVQRRQQQQRAKPVNAGGDVATNRRERQRAQVDTAADMESRFGDIPI